MTWHYHLGMQGILLPCEMMRSYDNARSRMLNLLSLVMIINRTAGSTTRFMIMLLWICVKSSWERRIEALRSGRHKIKRHLSYLWIKIRSKLLIWYDVFWMLPYSAANLVYCSFVFL